MYYTVTCFASSLLSAFSNLFIFSFHFGVFRFYRAMHFSAERGLGIACRLSVRLSVCLSVCLSTDKATDFKFGE